MAWRVVVALSRSTNTKVLVRGAYDDESNYSLVVHFRDFSSEDCIEIQRDVLTVQCGNSRRTYYDWIDRKNARPVAFINGLLEDLNVPILDDNATVAPTPELLSYQIISECLIQSVGSTHTWECRCGADNVYGTRTHWFKDFPKIDLSKLAHSSEAAPEQQFWFILRNSVPVICVSTKGTIFTPHSYAYQAENLLALDRSAWHLVTNLPRFVAWTG